MNGMKKALILIIAAIAAIAAIRLASGEDGWACEGDTWTRHGNPESSAPTDGCGSAKSRMFVAKLAAVRRVGTGIVLDLDEVEFLSGDDARAAVMEDTGCAREKVEECAPSMNNDYYIRNMEAEVSGFLVSPGASVSIMKSPGSPVLSSSSPEELLSLFPDPAMFLSAFPFKVRTEGGAIVWIEEQYVP